MAGTGRCSVIPEAVIEEVRTLKARGIDLELIEVGPQCYVRVRRIEAPAPPWDKGTYEILIAIPAAYDDAGLDGFYLALPYQFQSGTHPRVSGAEVTYDGRNWKLVSWHYPENRDWSRGVDNLETHITHCKGFFLQRGAVNAP
jgi:hypothetical protein